MSFLIECKTTDSVLDSTFYCLVDALILFVFFLCELFKKPFSKEFIR